MSKKLLPFWDKPQGLEPEPIGYYKKRPRMKLQEYRNLVNLIEDTDSVNGLNNVEQFNKGFDAAMNLKLPIKFGEFISKPMPMEAKEIVRNNPETYMKDLYEWWLNNVFEV